MPRIIEDPTAEVCPDYSTDDWQAVRQNLINDHAGPQPLTHEAVAQNLRATWTALQARKITQWNDQQAEDQRAAAAQREEDEHRRIELVREAEEQRREQEKKKPKLNAFDPNRRVGDYIPPRPSAYALNKIQQLEYVELDYFTARGCKQAHSEQERAASNDTFGLTRVDDVVAFQPIASLKPSKNIRRDDELTWDELVQAKNTMLHFISLSKVWPEQHALSLAAFFVELEMHWMRQREHGNKIMVTYASRVRREWFDALKRNEGFNLELINIDLLKTIADEVKDAARAEEMRTVSTSYNIVTNEI